MTAPVQPQQPQATQFAPRQFAGRRASGGQGGGLSPSGSPQGDGSAQANGLSSMPQQQSQQNWQTSHPPQASASQGAQPTFAQMQANGQARPAPQQVAQQVQQPAQSQNTQSGVGGQLQSAVSNALANPSRYDLPQVQQVQSALTDQLTQQFGAQQKALDEQMAARGIGASSIAAGYNGDLAGQQSTALANMNASLIQNAAQTNAQDLTASLGAGQAYQTGQQNYQLGQGALGVQQQQANTAQQGVNNTYSLGMGNLGLGQQQLAQSGTQFQQNLGLQSQLGLGNLGVSQQQANTAATSAANQYSLGLGSLGINQQQVSNQANQFGQSFGLQQQAQNASQSQFAQSLQQALQLGTMSDTTANRGLDIQQQQGNNALLEELAAMGIGGTGATGASGGTGAGGSTAGTTSTGGTDAFLGSPAGQQLMQTNPALYGQIMMALNGGNVNAASANGTETISYGGQQYTPAQYYQLMQSNPSLFQGTSPTAANSAFFNQNAKTTATNQSAQQSMMQSTQQQAQQASQLRASIAQFQQQYGASGWQQPGSPGYNVPNPMFTLPDGTMLSQAQRDQASYAWSAANAGG